jgi:hypothetical protein
MGLRMSRKQKNASVGGVVCVVRRLLGFLTGLSCFVCVSSQSK